MVLRRWRDEGGVTAVEFALLFPLFFFVLVAGLEFGLVLYQRSVIESAVHQVARLALTGDLYGQDVSRDEFLSTEIKSRIKDVLLLDGEYDLDTRYYNSLKDLDGPGAESASSWGTKNQIVRYQLTYSYEFMTPLAHFLTGSEGQVTIRSTAFVKNENF